MGWEKILLRSNLCYQSKLCPVKLSAIMINDDILIGELVSVVKT